MDHHPQDHPFRRRLRALSNKVMIVAILGGIVMVLGTMVLTFQMRVNYYRQIKKTKIQQQNQQTTTTTTNQQQQVAIQQTERGSNPPHWRELHIAQRMPPPEGTSRVLAADAYWNRIVQVLQDVWGDAIWSNNNNNEEEDGVSSSSFWPWERLNTIPTSTSSSSSSMPTESIEWNSTTLSFALKQAAHLGNPHAQHVVANALASGIWPIPGQVVVGNDELPQDWLPNSHDPWLYWHMAAMGGNVESATVLAYRQSLLYAKNPELYTKNLQTNKNNNNKKNPTPGVICDRILPYFEVAANGIMDALETSLQSRGKVPPPLDKHILSTVHMHGGTTSKLASDNKPDESSELIQYYHLQATRHLRQERETPHVQAAYTLGHLYHNGVRGVPQNLTRALYYYEIAANHGHWEAAGQAGKFYFWGMGIGDDHNHTQDVLKAHAYFRKGTQFGLEGCKKRWREKIQQQRQHNKHKNDEQQQLELLLNPPKEIVICDHPSVNGMGLIRLFGISMVASRDLKAAEEWFTLAKDMGNMDAMYNLAMMKLGWHSHYRKMNEDDYKYGQSPAPDDDELPPFLKEEKPLRQAAPAPYTSNTNNNHRPTHVEFTSALELLKQAAYLGHVQARHRLAMLYSRGKSYDTSMALARDCNKAVEHYKWLLDNANPWLSQRLRKAYKQYMAGDVAHSLWNYLAAAEMGSELGQVNAAFLLDECNNNMMTTAQCAQASVRLWKAAAARGNAEACLRIGDVYYHGKLRNVTDHPLDKALTRPFGWLRLFVYPEESIPWLFYKIVQYFKRPFDNEVQNKEGQQQKDERIIDNDGDDPTKSQDEQDLAMAAKYYRMAATQTQGSSPRGHFHLGFLYEWGLGVKQDFPLAKRHYDLASSSDSTGEAALAVPLALWAMQIHEFYIKWKHYYTNKSWNEKEEEEDDNNIDRKTSSSSSGDASPVQVPRMSTDPAGVPLPPSPPKLHPKKKQTDVFLSFVLSWDFFLILVLLWVLSILIRRRTMQQQHRRRNQQ